MAKLGEVMVVLKKEFGAGCIMSGSDVCDFERLPFGVFPLDLSLGGGIPQGKMSMLIGPESSGKTTVALKLIATQQQLKPEMEYVWIDAENNFDKNWARRLGVDTDKLILMVPETGEQGATFLEGVTSAEDLGIVVLDSVAALVPSNEIDGDMGRQQVGGNSQLVGRMVRKTVHNLITQSRQERYPTVLYINQIRFKIGVMFGNPETFPGGMTLRHYCNMIIRVYAKDVIVESVSKTNPALKEVTVSLSKWKVPIVAKTSKYKFAVIPHDNLQVGDSESFNTVLAYSKQLGYLDKKGKKWLFNGVEFNTQKEVVALLKKDTIMLANLQRQLIVESVMSENAIEPMEET